MSVELSAVNSLAEAYWIRVTSKQEVIGHDKKRASIFPFTARSSV